MQPKPSPNYLAGYPGALVEQVRHLIEQGKLGELLLRKFPIGHAVRSDKALYDYVQDLKARHMRNGAQLSKVLFDGKLQTLKNALGTHTSIARVQGDRLKRKREIRIATVFRDMPEDFLRMIVVHELAHLKEAAHDKAFYQLCQHMEPAYGQLEFDLRAYLSYLDGGGSPLWQSAPA